MRVVMIGSGYVGLVSGACFADFGHLVTCVDKDADKIARLRHGKLPIFEPSLLQSAHASGFTDELRSDTSGHTSLRNKHYAAFSAETELKGQLIQLVMR